MGGSEMTERERFEEWAKAEGWSGSDIAEQLWMAWEARAELPDECMKPLTNSQMRSMLDNVGLARGAQGEQPAMRWQPIATAPKDGTKVLLYCAEARP